jgi:N utilization substance protein A
MEMEFPVDPDRFTRIAVQTTKQVITQKIREAERAVVFNEYKDRAGDIITAVVSRTDNKRNVFVDLGAARPSCRPKSRSRASATWSGCASRCS